MKAKQTRLIPEIGKIEGEKKTEVVFLTFMEPSIPLAYALADRYDNPNPALFLAPVDCSKT
jgi:hypothetical protein